MSRNRILILYENRTSRNTLVPGWGFSALVELDGKRVLFDAGADFLILKNNAQTLGVNLAAVDLLFLSHDHCDHIGGVPAVRRKGLEVYYPASFSSSFRDMMEYAKAIPHSVSQSVEIASHIHSLGELSGTVLGTTVTEQALLIEGENGPVLITGCAHPGIVNIARAATELIGKPVHLLLGGFHLMLAADQTVQDTASALLRLGVQHIAPCHCTGKRATDLLHRAFGNSFTEIALGSEVKL